jgi:uncharacterized protein involved in exopolysaccharide biosynthesis
VPVESSGIGFGALPAEAAGLLSGIDLLGGQASMQQLVPMLRSRRLLVPISRDFDLARRYDADPPELAWSVLAEQVGIEFDEAGGLLISVTDSAPDTAALIANRLVADLETLNETLRRSSASMRRDYLEGRLERVVSDLEAATDSMRAFQETHRVLSVEEEARAQVQMLGSLIGELISIEVERDVLAGTSGPEHPRVQQLDRTVEALRVEIERLAGHGSGESGEEDAGDVGADPELTRLDGEGSDGDRGASAAVATALDERIAGVLPRLSDLPQLGQRYYHLLQEVALQQKIFEVLVQQLELARMNEEWEAPAFQVLDPAVPPPLRSFPKRKSLLLLVTCLGFAAALALAVAAELAERTLASSRQDDPAGRASAELLDAIEGLPLVGGRIGRWRRQDDDPVMDQGA